MKCRHGEAHSPQSLWPRLGWHVMPAPARNTGVLRGAGVASAHLDIDGAAFERRGGWQNQHR